MEGQYVNVAALLYRHNYLLQVSIILENSMCNFIVSKIILLARCGCGLAGCGLSAVWPEFGSRCLDGVSVIATLPLAATLVPNWEVDEKGVMCLYACLPAALGSSRAAALVV